MDNLRDLQFQNHNHDGTNSFRIQPENLLIFTQQVTNATVAPTDTPLNGTVRVLYDIIPKYQLWIRIGKVWKSVALS
jgi:hypothetical protein